MWKGPAERGEGVGVTSQNGGSKLARNIAYIALDLLVHVHTALHGATGMQHRGVSLGKTFPDIGQRQVSQSTTEVHGYLTGHRNGARPPATGHIGQTDVKMFGNRPLNGRTVDLNPLFEQRQAINLVVKSGAPGPQALSSSSLNGELSGGSSDNCGHLPVIRIARV